MLRIATRKSALALWQAERVQGWLRERGHACELVPMSTQGDRIADRPLAEVGGKGLFVKELEQERDTDRRIPAEVHLAKDDAAVAFPPDWRLQVAHRRRDVHFADGGPLDG